MKTTSCFNLENAKYPVVAVADGIRIDAPLSGGKLVGKKRADGSYRRQCGEFCNDAIGIPGFISDTLVQKKTRVTTSKPSPGSVAVLDVPGAVSVDKNGKVYKNGHVLLIERIRGGDNLTWAESNFDGKENFRRVDGTLSDLRARGLIGFTAGLDMTPAPDLPSSWAVPAFAAAAKYGFSSTNPKESIATIRGRHALAKDPTLKGHLEDKDESLTYEEYITALYKAGRFA